MEIVRAATAGFCMGVDLALHKLEEALRDSAKPARGRICTLGPIIHNPQTLANLERRGVIRLDEACEVRAGDVTLIRAHGVPLSDESRLRSSGAKIVDATCPKVKKAQLSIAETTADGAILLLFGEAAHPEVRGLVSYAKGVAHVFEDWSAILRQNLSAGARYVLASQTTQDRDAFNALKERLSASLPFLTVLDTICDATGKRQEEARRIAARTDAMVVVGGRESGNTRRLALVAQSAGIPAFHVETCRELDPAMFRGKRRIGLTAGASTPKCLIDETEEWLRSSVDNFPASTERP